MKRKGVVWVQCFQCTGPVRMTTCVKKWTRVTILMDPVSLDTRPNLDLKRNARIHVRCLNWDQRLGLSKPDQSPKTRPNRPTSTRTEGPVGRWWVSVLKNRHRLVEWWVCISKTWATQTRLELQKYPAKSRKNKPDPARSQPDLARSRPDLARFSRIYLDSAKFQQFLAKKNADFINK